MHTSLAPYLTRAEAGHIRVVEQDDLVLFNYTDKCTFDKAWDIYTLNSRGHIFEKNTGEIVANSFSKFFNYSERPISDQHQRHLDYGNYYIQEKMDGSLGIVYWYDDKWNVATRGSFTSEQAIKAASMLDKYNFELVHKDFTYLVEIIYPENKIIVPYGQEEKLVLLAARHTKSGMYHTSGSLEIIAEVLRMQCAGKISGLGIETALEKSKHIPYTEEGWVVVVDNSFRIKIKGKDYLRIAKFKANLSPLAVWEAIQADTYASMEQACPEEIAGELKDIHHTLMDQLYTLESRIQQISVERLPSGSMEWKVMALSIQKMPKWSQGALFSLFRGQDNVRKILLSHIRPTGNVFVDISKFEYVE